MSHTIDSLRVDFVEPLAEAVNGHRHQHVRHRAAWALGEIAADTPTVRAALVVPRFIGAGSGLRPDRRPRTA